MRGWMRCTLGTCSSWLFRFFSFQFFLQKEISLDHHSKRTKTSNDEEPSVQLYVGEILSRSRWGLICWKRKFLDSHAVGMALVRSYGFKIDFLRDSFFWISYKIFRFIREFIFLFKFHEKILDAKRISFSKADLNKTTYT